MKAPIAVAASMGVQSTAILAGLFERGIRPDIITFADTGGERPETYAYLPVLQAWLAARDWPPVVVVRNDGNAPTLEGLCLTSRSLPALAYGYRACSEKYKGRPQHKYLRRHCPLTMEFWAHRDAAGRRGLVRKLIGYDRNEIHRFFKMKDDAWYVYEAPLIDWGWGRDECRAALLRVGLPIPAKTACFFCPGSTVPEIRDLYERHPDLWERALEIEKNAELKTVKGLGRRFAWRDLPQLRAWESPEAAQPKIDCMCIGETPEDDGLDADQEEDDSSSTAGEPNK